MALKEQDIVFTTKDDAGNSVLQMPITRVENVEGAVRTVNGGAPNDSGEVHVDVGVKTVNNTPPDQSGNVNVDLSSKRDHTVQVANADLNTLLDDKSYSCSGTLKNTPIACTFCIVHAYDTGEPISGNIVQVCYVPQTDNTVRAFWRNCVNGATFGKWSESGAVKTVNNFAPDASGNVQIPAATSTTYGVVRAATDVTVLDEDAADAAITPAVYLDVSDCRHKSTAYALGDKVECMFNFERFLECTKAGTTSADPLDTRSVTHGQVIADGTVEWAVRTHVRSINGSVAGADGKVLVDVGAKTVEGKAPDGSGNVALGLHAVATSGDYNDLANRPAIPATPKVYVTATWNSGSSWYRVWSDGWKEQGGHVNVAIYSTVTVTLHLSMSNTNYTILEGSQGGSESTMRINTGQTTTSFSLSRHYTGNAKGNGSAYWYVCGY